MRTVKIAPGRTVLLLCAALVASLCLLVTQTTDARAAVWGTPEAVTSSYPVATGKASTAVDASGNVTAVWSEMRSGYYGVYASRYTGSSWSTPVLISAAGLDATQAVVVVDATGVATALWNVASGNNNIMTAARYANDAWSTPVAVSGTDRNASNAYPRMAVDPSGVVTAVWSQYITPVGMGSVVIMASRLSSGSWSTPVRVSQSNCNGTEPQVATSGTGSATVIWTGCDAAVASTRIQSAQFASGSWGAVATFEPTLPVSEDSPVITADGSGVITALWKRRLSDYTDRVVSARLVGGSWSAPTDLTGTVSSPINLAVAADATGNVTATWLQYVTPNYRVAAARFAGSTWSTPELISPSGGAGVASGYGNAVGVSLVAGASGVAVAAWSRSDGTDDRIQVARYASGSWGSPQEISSSGQNARVPTLAMDSTGSVTALWGKVNACFMGCSFNGIFAARYADAAPPVNCGTSGTFTITANHIVSSSSCVGTVTVPSTVTDIDASAFSGAAITGVTFTAPSSLTTIGAYAFLNTTSLSAITLPNSVTTIGQSAFNGSHVASVTLPSNVSFTTIPTGMFANASSLTSITIPTNVTTLNMDAFNAASSLTGVTFASPSSVTSIGDRAFKNTTALTTVALPNSVSSLGSEMFYSATALSSVTLPNGITSIPTGTFQGASGLTSILIPNGVTNIGGYAFAGTTSLTSVVLPNSVTSISGNYAFNGSGITSITLPTNPSFTSIPLGFLTATPLTSITIPNSVTSIGTNAFQNVSTLTTLTIPSSVTTLSDSAFTNMTALTRIEFLGNQPTCSGGFMFPMPCTSLLSGSTNATVYRFASATGWPTFGSTYQSRTQAYLVLPTAAPTAVAGEASATVTVTAPSGGPTPDTYTVAAVSDGSKTCTITAPVTSCTVSGLTSGTSYTFTAVANTASPAASSVTSAASNAVTPTAAVVPPSDNGSSTTPTSTSTATTTTSSTAAASTVLRLASTRPDSTRSMIVTTFTAPTSGSVHHVGTVTTGRRKTRVSTLTVCTYDKTINAAGVVQVTCNLNNTGRRLRTQQALVITLTTTYTPTSGTPMVSTKNVKLSRTPVAKAPAPTSTTPSSVTG